MTLKSNTFFSMEARNKSIAALAFLFCFASLVPVEVKSCSGGYDSITIIISCNKKQKGVSWLFNEHHICFDEFWYKDDTCIDVGTATKDPKLADRNSTKVAETNGKERERCFEQIEKKIENIHRKNYTNVCPFEKIGFFICRLDGDGKCGCSSSFRQMANPWILTLVLSLLILQ